MKLNKIDISKSLHKAFLQEKPQKEEFDKFNQNLQNFIENANEKETDDQIDELRNKLNDR